MSTLVFDSFTFVLLLSTLLHWLPTSWGSPPKVILCIVVTVGALLSDETEIRLENEGFLF